MFDCSSLSRCIGNQDSNEQGPRQYLRPANTLPDSTPRPYLHCRANLSFCAAQFEQSPFISTYSCSTGTCFAPCCFAQTPVFLYASQAFCRCVLTSQPHSMATINQVPWSSQLPEPVTSAVENDARSRHGIQRRQSILQGRREELQLTHGSRTCGM
jgi:hypothetical protein